MKKSKKDYDFTGLAYEITGDALYQINGGAVIENSIKAQSEAHEGDFVTNSRNETHKLTQDEIDWAKAEMARREQASATSDPSSNSSPSNKANTNKNSAKDNRETELCINPSNYQDQPTDERGYYSTTANYKNTTASESNAMKGSVTEGNAFVEFKEVSSSYESINSKKKVNGQVTLGVNLNAVAMIGFDASIGLQFNLDDSSKSGLLLSGGFASGVSLGASLFAGYNSGKVDAKNLVTISVGGGPAGVSFGVDSDGKFSLNLSYIIPNFGIDAGFNSSIQHSIVLPFATEDEKKRLMEIYYEHH